jgi:predicted GH43/DUF377 family glycosyl hydrolase
MVAIENLVILSPTTFEFENTGVLNPAVYQDGDTLHILYRAVQDGNFSTIACKTDGPINIVERREEPLITRDFDYENKGLEDPAS